MNSHGPLTPHELYALVSYLPDPLTFENYTALGYGDALPVDGNRLIGPITSLNGVLLIGWSVAVIFEVMRMAELSFGFRRKTRD